MFYISLCMLALGSGGVRGALPALGGDQFDQKDPKEAKALASYFNRLLLCITIGAAIGVTGIVWVSTKKNWYWGFFISTVAAFVGFGFLAIGKPLYRLRAPGESPIVRITQVSLSLSLSLTHTHTHAHTQKFTSPQLIRNLFVGFEFLQVIVMAIKNQKLSLPENPGDLYEINDKETISNEEHIAHTNQFR